jgi:hypothetical protein
MWDETIVVLGMELEELPEHEGVPHDGVQMMAASVVVTGVRLEIVSNLSPLRRFMGASLGVI